MNWSDINNVLSHLSEPLYLSILGLVFAFTLILLILLKRQPKQLVAYKTENGYVTVSRLAVVELVRTACSQFGEISKPSVKIHVRRKYAHLTIYIKFAGDGYLKEVEKTLQSHLRQNLSENLGIEHLGNINIVITGFKNKQIAPSRKVLEKNDDFDTASEKVKLELNESTSEKPNQEPG